MDLNVIEQIGKGANINETPNKRVCQRGDVPVFSGSVEQLDQMYNNPVSSASTQQTVFNPRSAMTAMTENIAKGRVVGGNKMPSAIREAVISNPLIMSESVSDDMSRFTGKLAQSLSGIQKTMGILEHVEQKDKERQREGMTEAKTVNAGGAIDYELIKMIIETAIEKKIGELKPMLNESVGRQAPDLSVMKIGDKFLFLDGDDNIYECKMEYKGKNKHKKKK